VDIGFNYRLDEPRAALGLSRLPRLDDEVAARRALVRRYRAELADVPGLTLVFDEKAVERSSHFAFPVLLDDRAARDAFREELKGAGVQTTWYPALSSFAEYLEAAPAGQLGRAIETADRHCALPLSPTMDDEAFEIVIDAARSARSASH
jgi:dTDP-4-amino-4,6-dideoxygalactose transaminase